MASQEAVREIAESMPAASFGLGDTWPARLAKSIYHAVTLPGDVYAGNVSMVGDDGRTNPAVVDRAADLAGVMTMGGLAGIPENAVGSGLARMKYNPFEQADLHRELAVLRRNQGLATGKAAKGWEFKRPDAPRGSWDDLVARTKAKWETDKSRAIGEFEQAAPSAAPGSQYMTPEDWAFIAKNGGLGVLLPIAGGGAVLSRQDRGAM